VTKTTFSETTDENAAENNSMIHSSFPDFLFIFRRVSLICFYSTLLCSLALYSLCNVSFLGKDIDTAAHRTHQALRQRAANTIEKRVAYQSYWDSRACANLQGILACFFFY
jgi:hypothetical protein